VPEYLCHGYEKENNHTKVKAQEAYWVKTMATSTRMTPLGSKSKETPKSSDDVGQELQFEPKGVFTRA
jgi:hypothetical protein